MSYFHIFIETNIYSKDDYGSKLRFVEFDKSRSYIDLILTAIYKNNDYAEFDRKNASGYRIKLNKENITNIKIIESEIKAEKILQKLREMRAKRMFLNDTTGISRAEKLISTIEEAIKEALKTDYDIYIEEVTFKVIDAIMNDHDCSQSSLVSTNDEEKSDIIMADSMQEIETEEGNDEPLPQGMVQPFDTTKITILTKQDSMQNLINRLKNDEIDLNTDFQRHADLWSDAKMSLLIESILIRFPLPAFYFDATKDESWQVVDGLQRLSTIKKFVVDNKLKLKSLEYLGNEKDVLEKTYSELPRSYQRRIDECPVTLFLIQPGTPTDVKYNVFKRINTGGLVLNSQEIRNAMAKKRERDFLEKLSEYGSMKKIFNEKLYKRMRVQELVLRFIAFYTLNYEKDSISYISLFLNKAMEELKKKNDGELNEIEKVFMKTIDYCYSIFGNSAFEKKSSKKNSALFEVWMVILSKLTDSDNDILVVKKKAVISKLNKLIENDKEFSDSISVSTQKKENYKIRYERIKNLIKEVLNA